MILSGGRSRGSRDVAAIPGGRGRQESPRRLCSPALRAFREALASAMRAIGRASPKVSSPQRTQWFHKAAAGFPACFAADGKRNLQGMECRPGVQAGKYCKDFVNEELA